MDTAPLDEAIAALKADEWAKLDIGIKIGYLNRLLDNTAAQAENWALTASRAKCIPVGSRYEGEEWISGPWALIYALKGYIRTLTALRDTGKPPQIKTRQRDNGQLVVDVFPNNPYDYVLLSGIHAEVWMQPEVNQRNLSKHMATFYQQRDPQGKIALVLGAGNINSIPPLDVLYKLIADGEVVICKLNPVNEYLGEFLEAIFAPMIEAGYVRFVYGGGDVGAYLTQHEAIASIHITGSVHTHDAIVFGSGKAGEKRKKQNKPLLDKPITSELGAVCPTIVVPGDWSDADIQFQAEHIVTQRFHNGGFNCVASQVLILPESWNRAPDLLKAIERVIESVPAREAYYPGADQRQQAAVDAHPDHAIKIDLPEFSKVPRTFITQLDPNQTDDPAFNEEFFCGVLAQTSLPGNTPLEFLRNAVKFANDTLWGTLGANIIIHPRTMDQLGILLEDCIADLRYGTVGVNAWTGAAYFITECMWGAFPGHTLDDVQSGIGSVHNTYLFDKPQKNVVYAPFAPFPRSILLRERHIALKTPTWFVTNHQANKIGKRFTYYEAERGSKIPHVLGLVATVLKG